MRLLSSVVALLMLAGCGFHGFGYGPGLKYHCEKADSSFEDPCRAEGMGHYYDRGYCVCSDPGNCVSPERYKEFLAPGNKYEKK